MLTSGGSEVSNVIAGLSFKFFNFLILNGVYKNLGKVYICGVQKSRKGDYEKKDI